MRQVIVDFLFMRAQNSNPTVYVALVLVYVIMLVATVTSVLKQPVGRSPKTFFIALAVFVPFVGMLIYTIRCILKADYSSILRFKPRKAHPSMN